ncbi:hypothetical protein PP590_gp08 [Pseudoalteromonas phage HS1]|uniref:hypothetical protein n=1 Tax=Pseudoalteromonas phage HS5 TaxID=1357709 RepID=UPI00232963A1|nr:hypothetical protein PP589_gp62 [Pseudoalteromonas phage HS5]YP_010660165.1 hypothetical protein PP590_gp08 [Pseudoalteromonas phage HS1]
MENEMKFILLTIVLFSAYFSFYKAFELFAGFEIFQYTALLVICICSICAFGIIEHQFEKGNNNE